MKSYTFSQYKQLQELNTIDKFIGNLKKNKKEYAKLVFLLAITIPKNSFATSLDAGMSNTFQDLFNLLVQFAKFGCLFMGTKKMVECMLIGANLKEASTAGIQYYVFYILLQFYPKLFGL